jgi:chromosome segregation protein
MTRLTKLTLKNFKSFKKAEFPISNGFTAIVGSNGSGKSNVLDALLFVLGITSLKTLRAGKLTDLVNNTAKENYAKVSLDIKDNGKSYEVSRMIDKQGKSIYRLDGKRTTRNEISSLLIELGIDVTGHNIVTQGDITKIIEMSPMERRIIVDNVAGLSEFDQKKDEAVKELNKVDSRIKEATIILNERTTFLEELEKEMTAAKEYSALESEMKQIKGTIIWKELYSIEKRSKEIEKELLNLIKEKEEKEKNIELNRVELKKSKEESNELSKKAVKASEEVYTTIGREFEEKKGKLSIAQEKSEMKKVQIEKNNKKIEYNEEVAKDNDKERAGITIEQKQIDIEMKELLHNLSIVEKKKREIEEVVEKKNTEIVESERSLDEINKIIEEKRKELFDLEVFEKNWEKQKSFNTRKLEELNQELKNKETQLNQIYEKKKEIKTILNGKNVEEEIEKIMEKINKLNIAQSKIIAQSEQEEKALAELKKEISKCPVCDANLEKDKKEKIAQEKKQRIEKLDLENKKYALEQKELQEKYTTLKEDNIKIGNLTAQVSNEDETLESTKSISQKIKEVEAELDEKQFALQLNKKKILDEKLKESLTKKEAAKEHLKTLRSQNIFVEYSGASKAHEELLNKKSSKEAVLNEINAKIVKISSSEEGISIENLGLEKENTEFTNELKELGPIIANLIEDVSKGEKVLKEAQKKSSELLNEKEKKDKEIGKREQDIYTQSTLTRKVEGRINEFNIEKSRIEVRQADLEEESKEYNQVEQIKEKSNEEMKERLGEVEKRLNNIGAVNMKAVDNFKDLKEEVDEISEKSEKLTNERLAVLDMIDKIDVKRTSVFMDCFNEINHNFQDMFSKFFNGEGNLSLTNQEEPLESGLLVDAQPKGGKLQNIDSMSGGEKTLTALAFMFAIQLYSPAPFYAFDEADAALDKENSMKMGSLIEKIAQKSQFISVTHNDTITKKASQIIGVALNKDNSSVIGLKLKNQN